MSTDAIVEREIEKMNKADEQKLKQTMSKEQEIAVNIAVYYDDCGKTRRQDIRVESMQKAIETIETVMRGGLIIENNGHKTFIPGIRLYKFVTT